MYAWIWPVLYIRTFAATIILHRFICKYGGVVGVIVGKFEERLSEEQHYYVGVRHDSC